MIATGLRRDLARLDETIARYRPGEGGTTAREEDHMHAACLIRAIVAGRLALSAGGTGEGTGAPA